MSENVHAVNILVAKVLVSLNLDELKVLFERIGKYTHIKSLKEVHSKIGRAIQMNIIQAENIVDLYWEKMLACQTSFREMTRAAKRLTESASEETAALINLYVFNKAKEFNGIMLGVDLTKGNTDMRRKLGEEYGLAEQQLDELQKVIDKKGYVFNLYDDPSTGKVEIPNVYNII